MALTVVTYATLCFKVFFIDCVRNNSSVVAALCYTRNVVTCCCILNKLVDTMEIVLKHVVQL